MAEQQPSQEERVGRLIDALAQAVMGCARATREARELRRADGLTVVKLEQELHEICTKLEAVATTARTLL